MSFIPDGILNVKMVWQIVNYSNPYLVAKIQVTGHKMIRLLPRGIKIPGAIITF